MPAWQLSTSILYEPLAIQQAKPPAALASYRQQLENLSKTLNDHMVEGEQGPVEALRALVASVIVHRTEPGEPLSLEVKGKLSALLEKAVFPNARIVGGSGNGLGVLGGSGGGI
ncbi:MAG: hypothetical protein ACK5KM_14475 [Hyphomicrobiaceae bacterium]